MRKTDVFLAVDQFMYAICSNTRLSKRLCDCQPMRMRWLLVKVSPSYDYKKPTALLSLRRALLFSLKYCQGFFQALRRNLISQETLLEECGRFVRRPFLAKVALLSAMLGITLPLFPFQSTPSSSPAVSPHRVVSSIAMESEPKHANSPAREILLRALKLLADVYATCPSYENGRDLADAEIKAGQYESAKSLLNTLLEQQDRAELHSLLGAAESGENNYKAAAIEYQKAATIDPSEANVFDFGMSLLHLDQNAAITIFRYGLQKYPKSVKVHVALGAALYAAGKSLEGAQLLCDAEDLNPSDPHPMEILADTEIVPPALAPKITSQFASLHKRYPNDGLVLFDYTMVQSGRWSNDKAALPPHFTDSLKAALTLNPQTPSSLFPIGPGLCATRQVRRSNQRFKKGHISGSYER